MSLQSDKSYLKTDHRTGAAGHIEPAGEIPLGVVPSQPYVPWPTDASYATIVERFERMVVEYPERLAVRDAVRSLTYRELNDAANRLAYAILGRRDEAREIVALLLEHGAATVVGILGVLKAGKGYVALDRWNPSARSREILEDSGAGMLVVSGATRAAASDIASPATDILDLNDLPSDEKDGNPGVRVSPSTATILLYTSGSTGRPKGVISTHEKILQNIRTYTKTYRYNPDDRIAVATSFSGTSAGSSAFGALLNGGAVLPFDLKQKGTDLLAAWLDRERITVIRLVPAVFRQLAAGLEGGNNFPRLRLIQLGGDTIRHSDIGLYRSHFVDGCLLRLGMGLTETGNISMMLIGRDTELPKERVPVGYPAEDVEVTLVDEGGLPVPPGEVGEIQVRGDRLSPGYWRRPDLTARAFRPHPSGDGTTVFRTGDLGRIDARGLLYHLGRKDFQVKIRGNRVEIGEVESALLRIPGVRDAAVAAHGNPGERALVAYIVSSRTPPLSAGEARAALATELPEFMVPSAYVFLDALPLLSSGKVNRAALPAPPPERPRSRSGQAAPRDELEETVAGTWREVLGVPDIGVEDNFFELGGQSLLAARIVARLNRALNPRLDVRSLFDAPTVGDLARVIRSRLAGESLAEARGPEGLRP